MTDRDRKRAAKKFAEYWSDKGYEKGESQAFWLSLLRDVFGVEHPEQYIKFENKVHLDRTSFIDGFIEKNHILVEQKSVDKSLRKPIKQSDGTLLTPFQQAKRYSSELPYSKRPRWIVTCNFKEFLVYDMEKPTGEPESILLSDFPKEYYRLEFLIEEKSELLHREEHISIKAGELVGKLYDAILRQYIAPENKSSLHSLNILCVRLVFCFYAEDAGIFRSHKQFHNYIKSFETKDVRRAVIDLFRVLDTKYEDRDPYIDKSLADFPYVNGGLFADEDIEIPNFTDEIVNLLLYNVSDNFDWSQISPTIFGAVFESTLNPETRRGGGMHYTSIENIHKVTDPLFLDELHGELEEIQAVKVPKIRREKAEEFREKLSKLVFFDPACGSGNFLTETYISLRRLENEALKIIFDDQIILDFGDVVKVSIGQFYGIEINDFAVTVAKTALWIAESQMLKETEDILNTSIDFLPLKSYANIVCGNALRIDWETVVPKDKLGYIMGNPPFVGGMITTPQQKEDMIAVMGNIKGIGELDYVSAWYYKSVDFIHDKASIKVAFVSTNSICQGQQAVTMWQPLYRRGIKIQFAYRTFIWNSEAKTKARVHCVIVGFSMKVCQPKILYDNDTFKYVDNINSYLLDAPDIFVESRSTPICKVPEMRFGSMPRDGGGFILTDEQREELLKKEPIAEKWIKKYVGAYEFINNKSRWCLWLLEADPHEIKQCPTVMKRIESVREFRAGSVAAGTRKFAETPTLFCQIAQPKMDYIIVPKVSSEKRKYVPIGFMPNTVIASDLVFLIPNASLYNFGILTSNVHMAWMRAVCGRLKSDYRYAKDIVYNNFPWCKANFEQRERIEQTAQGILDARALYPDCSLADLYDELTMPSELRRAHQENDRAVMQAYGFDVKTMTESDCVAELMKMYKRMTRK